jgi:EAL domain-containing protein (putative c-di-GMP-specific phosphodiesterase class I)
VDELKVDRAFVQAMTTTQQDAIIVKTATELGHNLGMAVVAEGVENTDILAEVVAAGCGYLQGYYFSRPLPAGELLSWWENRVPGSAVAPQTVRTVA